MDFHSLCGSTICDWWLVWFCMRKHVRSRRFWIIETDDFFLSVRQWHSVVIYDLKSRHSGLDWLQLLQNLYQRFCWLYFSQNWKHISPFRVRCQLPVFSENVVLCIKCQHISCLRSIYYNKIKRQIYFSANHGCDRICTCYRTCLISHPHQK